jgi:lipoprotein-releasing system ATP-binding protein
LSLESKNHSEKSAGFAVDSRLPTPDSRLIVDGLRKSYAAPGGVRVEVLRGVSFEARAGELLAIIGASGAGKSTLLHLCGGLDAADAGSVRAFDFDVTRASSSELTAWRARGVGFVFQFHHLLPALTTIENVAMPLMIARRGRDEARETAARALEEVGLSDRANHLPGELSGGEQQRAAIARAVVANPQLVLADEPTGNLDARAGDAVGELLAQVARSRGACVIVATHNERLARLCDRTLTISDGLLRGQD